MFYLCGFEESQRTRWNALAEQCQERLRAQKIRARDPGAVLADIEMLLGFVGAKGIRTGSRNANLPPGCLPELNAKVSHPIKLDLTRALLKDYPNLAGLFILLRVMDLFRMQGNRLVVCPAALEGWRNLNPTEQYFALLEAFLFHAQSPVLGGESSPYEDAQVFQAVTCFLGQLSDHWRNVKSYEAVRIFGPTGEFPPWKPFLLQQFGLVEIRRQTAAQAAERRGGRGGWYFGGVKITPWGQALAWALIEFMNKREEQMDETAGAAVGEGDEIAPGDSPASLNLPEEAEECDAEDEDTFGTLQPVFQPYFPEWERVFVPISHEPRAGTYIFKVTVSGWRGNPSVWRRLAVPPDNSLENLAGAILRAFGFYDSDHLYDFSYRDQRGKRRVYFHPYTDKGPYSWEIDGGNTDLAIKDQMTFTFDYGDKWQFTLLLEKVEEGPSALAKVEVIESAGAAPPQYPNFEE